MDCPASLTGWQFNWYVFFLTGLTPLRCLINTISSFKDWHLLLLFPNWNKRMLKNLAIEGWILAMEEDLNEFTTTQSVIITWWIFRNKLNKEGKVARNKIRTVAQGYNKQEGINFNETFDPDVRWEAIRIQLVMLLIIKIMKLFSNWILKSVF